MDVQQLIAAMARANATWGEERIAAELRLKLGLCVSPRTVRLHIGLEEVEDLWCELEQALHRAED